jgi:hypothetical protein
MEDQYGFPCFAIWVRSNCESCASQILEENGFLRSCRSTGLAGSSRSHGGD